MFDSIIRNALRVLAGIVTALAFCMPASGSHLVTGNGFGFAVVAPESGLATKFYPHPYSFVRRDPANPLSEGIEATNFIRKLGWGGTGQEGTAKYLADSHVIRMRTASGA